MKRLVVVGAGITGLAAAHRAQCLLGLPSSGDGGQTGDAFEVVLLEREERLGGKILTEREGDFLLEGAADSFLTRKPAAFALCEELGMADRLVGQLPQPIRSFVRHRRELYPLPEGFSGMVPTNLEALVSGSLLSPAAKHRVMMEPAIPPGGPAGDESIAHFMARRFGPEVFDLLVEPLLAGVYAGDASSLSLMATFPRLREMERRSGSLLRGLAAEGAAAPALHPPFVTLPEGMGGLVEALGKALTGVRVLTRREARAVREGAGGGYRIEMEDGTSMAADALVLAIPAAVAAPLLIGFDGELAKLLATIPFASVAIIHLGFRRADFGRLLEGYGYLIPQVEGSDLLACTFTSSKWAGRAPEDAVLLRLYAGRFGGESVTARTDRALLALARSELAETLKVKAEPILSRIYRWERALPQYTLGHLDRLAAIDERLLAHPGLHLAGASYRGVGIPDCIESGFNAANAAVSSLSGGGT